MPLLIKTAFEKKSGKKNFEGILSILEEEEDFLFFPKKIK